MRPFVVVLALLVVSPIAPAADSRPAVDIPERAQGADAVVVGSVVDVQTSFRVNRHGDQLIVSRATVEVHETLKGRAAGFVEVDIEGGTVGDLTLDVSDMPKVARGERATFFLRLGDDGAHVPHLRGLGILKLDADDRVQGSSLTLDAIRSKVASRPAAGRLEERR